MIVNKQMQTLNGDFTLTKRKKAQGKRARKGKAKDFESKDNNDRPKWNMSWRKILRR